METNLGIFRKGSDILDVIGFAMLALWLKVCKGKVNVMQLVQALTSRKIKAADTTSRDSVTDPVDADSILGLSAGNTGGQPVAVQVQKVAESGLCQMTPMVLDLASVAPKSV